MRGHGGSPRQGRWPGVHLEEQCVASPGLSPADGQEAVKPLKFLFSTPASHPLGFRRASSGAAAPPGTAEGAFEGEALPKCPGGQTGKAG